MDHRTRIRTRRPARFRSEAVTAAISLAVIVAAAALVAALPHLIVVPDAVAVGARGLSMACLMTVYVMGVAMQPFLLPRRRRRRVAAAITPAP